MFLWLNYNIITFMHPKLSLIISDKKVSWNGHALSIEDFHEYYVTNPHNMQTSNDPQLYSLLVIPHMLVLFKNFSCYLLF